MRGFTGFVTAVGVAILMAIGAIIVVASVVIIAAPLFI